MYTFLPVDIGFLPYRGFALRAERWNMSLPIDRDREGVAWQRGIWDRYPEVYRHEVDPRFAPVVEQVIRRAALSSGQHVLDLGTGTGSVALRAAPFVIPNGHVLGVDLSPEMLAVARRRAT